MAGRKLEIRYDHPALNTDLFTPLFLAKDMPALHRLLKGKHKEMVLARDIGVTSVSTASMTVDDPLDFGVHLIPVQEVSGQYLLHLIGHSLTEFS